MKNSLASHRGDRAAFDRSCLHFTSDLVSPRFFARLNVGVGSPAGIKTAYSVPTKTKRLSYRGLEKGVTLDDGVGGVGGLDPSL